MSETSGSRSLINFSTNTSLWSGENIQLSIVSSAREFLNSHLLGEKSVFNVEKCEGDCHSEEKYFGVESEFHVQYSLLTNCRDSPD